MHFCTNRTNQVKVQIIDPGVRTVQVQHVDVVNGATARDVQHGANAGCATGGDCFRHIGAVVNGAGAGDGCVGGQWCVGCRGCWPWGGGWPGGAAAKGVGADVGAPTAACGARVFAVFAQVPEGCAVRIDSHFCVVTPAARSGRFKRGVRNLASFQLDFGLQGACGVSGFTTSDKNAGEHAGAGLGVPNGHIVAMVYGQIRELAIFTVAAIDARVDDGSRSRVDLRPAHTVNRTATWVTADGHGGPGVAIAVFKVLGPPIVAFQGAAARLGEGNGGSGRYARRGVQIHHTNCAEGVATKRVAPGVNSVVGPVVARFCDEIVGTGGWPGALIPAVQVKRLWGVIIAA